jgi:hypothetical protein
MESMLYQFGDNFGLCQAAKLCAEIHPEQFPADNPHIGPIVTLRYGQL